MNSKAEWHAPVVPRVVVTGELAHKEARQLVGQSWKIWSSRDKRTRRERSAGRRRHMKETKKRSQAGKGGEL